MSVHHTNGTVKSFISKENIENQERSSFFNLLIMGDMGQIDYFFKRRQIQKVSNQQILDWEKKFILNEIYNLKNFSCSIQRIDNRDMIDLIKEDGLENFKSIMTHENFHKKINDADNIVILGDIIYVETKNLLIKQKLNSFEKWINRLECGWNIFIRALEEVKLIKYDHEKDYKEPQALIDSRVDILGGNHDFDVNIFYQEKLYKNLGEFECNKPSVFYNMTRTYFGNSNKKKEIFTYTPVFITIRFPDFEIEILDFNSAMLYCIAKKESDYDMCMRTNSYTSMKDSLLYFSKIIEGLNKFNEKQEEKENYKIWKVIRTHIGPLNPEDGDELIYFDPINLNGKSYILIDEIIRRKINIIFSSHVHYSAVMAYSYSRKFIDNRIINPTCLNLSKTAGFGCYAAPGEGKDIFLNELEFSKNCQNQKKFILPINNDSDNDKNNILYQFISGNSGRNLEPLKEGRDSNGFLIWSRSMKENDKFNYGFSTANFYKNKLEIKFFEVVNDEPSLIKTADFTVHNGSIQNGEVLNHLINLKCDSSPSNAIFLYLIMIFILFFIYRYMKKKNRNRVEMNYSKFNII